MGKWAVELARVGERRIIVGGGVRVMFGVSLTVVRPDGKTDDYFFPLETA